MQLDQVTNAIDVIGPTHDYHGRGQQQLRERVIKGVYGRVKKCWQFQPEHRSHRENQQGHGQNSAANEARFQILQAFSFMRFFTLEFIFDGALDRQNRLVSRLSNRPNNLLQADLRRVIIECECLGSQVDVCVLYAGQLAYYPFHGRRT